MQNIRTLSLFSGAGGLDLGFHEEGFDIVGCLEIDPPSCETLQKNVGRFVFPSTKIFNKDITNTDPAELGVGEIDFIIGGPPCQSFSAAGRRAGGVQGINDTRGSLFWYYCNYLKYFQPSGFLFENVKGILQANKREDWSIILKSFEDVGYRLIYSVLDAADYGVPQHRERLILVGVRKDLGLNFYFPRPTHGSLSVSGTKYVTPIEVLRDLFDPDEHVEPYGGKYGHLLDEIPPGGNYSYYTAKLKHPAPMFAWRSKFSGFLYKMPMDEPCKTIVAHQGKYDGPFHWNNRKLTSLELKRMQSFPDDYEFVSSKTEIVRQIGNSVAPKMASNLAKAVKLQIFGANDSYVELIDSNDSKHLSERKAAKADKTRAKTRNSSLVNLSQLELFNEPKEFSLRLEQNTKIKTDGGSLDVHRSLNRGKWAIHISTNETSTPFFVEAKLSFGNPIGCDFNQIKTSANLAKLDDLSVMWDQVHQSVADSSSYSSLSELYGHFTEPHPQFALQFSISTKEPANNFIGLQIELIRKMSDFNFLSNTYKYDELFSSREVGKLVIKSLREIGFDIRTFETNRAIDENSFKPCYPFTNKLSVKKFITWNDKGSHKTGDVKIVQENGAIRIQNR